MRLAKASALINTTWQRLIRVAWVPSNQPIVSKPPSLAPAVPRSQDQYCMNLTSRHLSPEGFTFELRIRWVTRLNHIQRLSCCWCAVSFQYLVCPHRWWTGRGHCCMYCCFLWKERKKERKRLNDRRWPVSLVAAKLERELWCDSSSQTWWVVQVRQLYNFWKVNNVLQNVTWPRNVNI